MGALDTGTPAGVIATNDWIAIELDDGSWFIATVTVSGLVMTIAALPVAAAAGRAVHFFGLPADHTSTQTNPKPNPVKGSNVATVASTTLDLGDESGICQSLNAGESLGDGCLHLA